MATRICDVCEKKKVDSCAPVVNILDCFQSITTGDCNSKTFSL